MYYTTTYQSPVGLITLASDENNLLGAWIEAQKYHGGTLLQGEADGQQDDDNAILFDTKSWLDRYFASEKPAPSELPLAPMGTDFQKEVWGLLCEIPYGEVVSYGEIAKAVARNRNTSSMASRAVGAAVGRNPISIIVPCHRVIGSNGNLTGYAGGIDKKITLLVYEGIDVSAFSVPDTSA